MAATERVLIVGSKAGWALETYYCKYLNEQGICTTIFDCHNYYNSGSLVTRIRNRLGDDSIYRQVNSELLAYCRSKSPEIVWIFKGVEIYTETLKELKKLGILLANYNPDHPFIRTSITHGGRNIPDSIPFYDIYFSYSKALVKAIKSDYGLASVWLPFGFELSQQDYDIVSKEKEILRVGFIGTPDSARVKQLEIISKNGFPIDIYGQQYQDEYKLRRHSNINSFNVVLGLDFWKKIRQYRVQVNFFREHNLGSHNQRTFEVPGAGGILLTPDSQEQREFFENREEVIFYRDEAEMLEGIETLMAKSVQETNEMRNAAMERSVKSGYRYADRASIVVKEFNKILAI